jgi:hypothetical protein
MTATQCDQIVQNFAILGNFYLGMGNFYANKQFKNMVCDSHFNIQKQFDAIIWTFNLSFDILATVLATLPSIGRFFQSSGHSAATLSNL